MARPKLTEAERTERRDRERQRSQARSASESANEDAGEPGHQQLEEAADLQYTDQDPYAALDPVNVIHANRNGLTDDSFQGDSDVSADDVRRPSTISEASDLDLDNGAFTTQGAVFANGPESPLFVSSPAQNSPNPSSRPFSRVSSQVSEPFTRITPNSSVCRYVQAIQRREDQNGLTFIEKQSLVYDQVFRTFFNAECTCPESAENETEPTHTMKERTEQLQAFMPPLSQVLGQKSSVNANASFSRYRRFLADRPPEPLSFHKTQASIAQGSLTVSRQWDIDSVWLGAKSLQAILPPNVFRLSFLPAYALNFSTDQVVRPHGIELAKSRHIQLGTFSASNVRFSAFAIFPHAAQGPKSKTSAKSNALSLERQKDFYDQIIIPAAYETISDPVRQEIPQSYDVVFAKSRSFQEKPGTNRWKWEDESRSFRLQYSLPADDLPSFWRSVVEKANSVRVPTKGGGSVAYFENPQLLFQSHDLKNLFTQPTLEESLELFQEAVLRNLCPAQLDIRSCWLDIGCRDYVSNSHGPPYTLMWKSHCNQHLHEQQIQLAPDTPLTAAYFRSTLFRDAGTYRSKAKPGRKCGPGHPDTRRPGIIRAKAYDCNKEMFSVMFSDYSIFSSRFLPLLAVDENMMQELSDTSKKAQQVPISQLSRASLLKAWEANKRHLKAISESKVVANYGVRKEMTFRLDAVLYMWNQNYFDPAANPHTGRINFDAPLPPHSARHSPFWIVPSSDMNELVFAQAARFILPLDHLFDKASVAEGRDSSVQSQTQFILAFYTAQLLCRLLVLCLSSEQQLAYDNWIWREKWTTLKRRQGSPPVTFERRGLGIEEQIKGSGMLWIPRACMDWHNGHIELESLSQLYVPRSPLQARIASQKNIQSLSSSKLTVEYFIQGWLQSANKAIERGREREAYELMDKATCLAAEEVARAYHQHMLAKLQARWDRFRTSFDPCGLAPLTTLKQAVNESTAGIGRIVNAQTIAEVYDEAWEAYSQALPASNASQMPNQLPCWMVTRKFRPPQDGWSAFVFRHLFDPPGRPTWHQLRFLKLYRAFKKVWKAVRGDVPTFEDRFRLVIGRYIMVSFNSDQTKEVGTNHRSGSWYKDKPAFFQIQFWAPYFSPPASNLGIRWDAITNYEHGSAAIPPQTVSSDLTATDFDYTSAAFRKVWYRIMKKSGGTYMADPAYQNQTCQEALECLMILAGPQWQFGELDYVLPWFLPSSDEENEIEDSFRVPIPVPSWTNEDEEHAYRPTIILPTQHNVITLIDKIGVLPNLNDAVLKRVDWIRETLGDDEQEYSILSNSTNAWPVEPLA